ncbi:hypothetical protein HOP50_02g12290 [Chloropicon primus]|nr:hypothetical protein HOP50_02g12290 [Chloropicon primus]
MKDGNLAAEEGKLVGLRERREVLARKIAEEFERQCRVKGAEPGTANREAEDAGEGLSGYSYDSFVSKLGDSVLLHQAESDLRFQGDVIRLKDDLARSLAELQGVTSDLHLKLEGFRSTIEVMQVICTSFSENRTGKKKMGRSDGGELFPFSGATRSYLLSMCQQIRRELEKFLRRVLSTKCEAWPPRIHLSPGSAPQGEGEARGVLKSMQARDPSTFTLLCTSLRHLCALQKSHMDLSEEGTAKNAGAFVAKQSLWMTEPLLDEFKRKICFHFGQQGGTFRLDKPEWLLRYGLHAATVLQSEGKTLSRAIEGTGLEDIYSIPQELALGVTSTLQQILPQYLEIGEAFSGEEPSQAQDFSLLLLHLANKVREFDLKFAELLNPSSRESFYSQNPFSPLCSWDFGILINVLLREEYFYDWIGAERDFLVDKAEGLFKQSGAWDTEPLSEDSSLRDLDSPDADLEGHGVPLCVEQLCGLLTECINFSRSFPDAKRAEFLDSLCCPLLQVLVKKLSWRVDSYDPYGDTSRHSAIQATASCLASAAYVEGVVLDQCIYDRHTSGVECFKENAKGFVSHIQNWTRKLVSLLTKEFESGGVSNFRKQLKFLQEGKSQINEDTILGDFLMIFDDLVVQLREVRPKVTSDVYRVIWTSAAACINTQLFNKVALGVQHNHGTAAVLAKVVPLLVSAFEEFSRRPRAYFKLMVEASEVLSMGSGEGQALLEEIGSLKESESLSVLRAHSIHALSPLQTSQLLNMITMQ